MYSRKSIYTCNSDYYTQYQSIFDQIIVFDENGSSIGAENDGNEVLEEVVYSDYSNLYETNIQQPSHPYSGDITPTA